MMNKEDIRYRTYLKILEEELVPAMGCTEPIAVAFAAAKARDVLGGMPEKVLLQVSGSIIKNVKSVIVPNTGHLKGLSASAAAGITVGDAEKKLEVLSQAGDDSRERICAFLETVPVQVEPIEDGHIFDIIITEYAHGSYAKVRIAGHHTNIVLIEKDGETVLERAADASGKEGNRADRTLLRMEDIWEFIHSVDITDIAPVLDRQIQCNMAISEEGLLGSRGSNIGSVLLRAYGQDVAVRAKAKAAAGSDARMDGCELPVVINSGSGNQGLTCSVPVIEYAKELRSGREKLYRALALSNLVAIHEKTGIGTLSAFCGAVSAGAGAGAAIAFLRGADYEGVTHTVVNTLAIVSGIVCDGAKASCAAKIAESVGVGILGYDMFLNGQNFNPGDGLVMENVEATIEGIGILGRDGMYETNHQIIRLMLCSENRSGVRRGLTGPEVEE